MQHAVHDFFSFFMQISGKFVWSVQTLGLVFFVYAIPLFSGISTTYYANQQLYFYIYIYIYTGCLQKTRPYICISYCTTVKNYIPGYILDGRSIFIHYEVIIWAKWRQWNWNCKPALNWKSLTLGSSMLVLG